jgi:ribonuclease-3
VVRTPVSPSGSTVGIEKELGYRFSNGDILKEALTHRSFYHENPGEAGFHNERLEFLGDTILGLVISNLLYHKEPPFTEAQMARIKSYLVSGSVLSDIANVINLGEYLNLGKGEIETGGREKESILADCLEALFGAVFVDGGFSDAQKVILNLYNEIVKETLEKKTYIDQKTELQEISQREYGVLPVYRIEKEEGLEHEKIFTVSVSVNDEVLGTGTGPSKKKAETEAAAEALTKITAD